MKHFGKRLQRFRKSRRLTLRDLAEKTGSSPSHLCMLEATKSSRLSADLLFRLAKALEVAPEFLFYGESEVPRDEELSDLIYKYQRSMPATQIRLQQIMNVLWELDEKIV